MIEHSSGRRGRSETRPWGGITGDAAGRRDQRIASGGARLLPLVLASLLCACERDRPPQSPAPGRQVEAPLGQAAGQSGGVAAGQSAAEPAAPSPKGAEARIRLGKEVEPWLVQALKALAAEGRIDLDLPVAMHLPLLASPRSDAITPRQLMDHTAHLGARAYEDFLRANPGSDALKVQVFLVALGSDETPGERPEWRRAHLDVMGWVLIAVTGAPDLAGALSQALGDSVQSAESETEPITPIRGEVSVLASRDAEIREAWERGQ